MEKLNLMFDTKQFLETFVEAAGDAASAPTWQDIVVWVEGGVSIAGPPFAWGHGQMSYLGSNHAFDVSCLTVADPGAISIYATGRVTRLTKIADFDGCYVSSGVRLVESEGGLASHLQNERGVSIQLVATDAATAASRRIDTLAVRLNSKSMNLPVRSADE